MQSRSHHLTFPNLDTTGAGTPKDGQPLVLCYEPRYGLDRGSILRTIQEQAMTIQDQFGQIDIYVFDQILRGNIAPGMTVLDAGCGYGRNLVYLLRAGCQVFAVDADAAGVDHVRQL